MVSTIIYQDIVIVISSFAAKADYGRVGYWHGEPQGHSPIYITLPFSCVSSLRRFFSVSRRIFHYRLEPGRGAFIIIMGACLAHAWAFRISRPHNYRR